MELRLQQDLLHFSYNNLDLEELSSPGPSLHFFLMVNIFPETSIPKIQMKITKFIERWLNLPRCCTLATVFHPELAFPPSNQTVC